MKVLLAAIGVLAGTLSAMGAEVDDLARLEAFIRYPSVSSNTQEVNRAVRFLRSELEKDGLKTFVETMEGRDVLFASNDGSKTPDVLFSAHLDVVAAQKPEMFEPTRHDGSIWGRGASDCKEHVILAARLMRELKGKVSCGCIFGSDEEIGGKSTAFMVEKGYLPKKLAITLDSEQYMVTTRQKGLATYRVKKTLPPMHTGLIKGPVPSAIDSLIKAYQEIAAVFGDYEDGSWKTYVSISSISGTRTEAEISIYVRCARPEDWEKVEAMIREKTGEEFVNKRKSPPVWLDESDPVLNDFLKRMQKMWPERNCGFYHLNSSTDARHLQNLGVPLLITGIDASGGHTENEHLVISSFFENDKLFQEFLLENYGK